VPLARKLSNFRLQVACVSAVQFCKTNIQFLIDFAGDIVKAAQLAFRQGLWQEAGQKPKVIL